MAKVRYYLQDDQLIGPLSSDELKTKASSGNITPDSLERYAFLRQGGATANRISQTLSALE